MTLRKLLLSLLSVGGLCLLMGFIMDTPAVKEASSSPANWSFIGGGSGNSDVFDMIVESTHGNKTIYAATLGRGIYQYNNNTWTPLPKGLKSQYIMSVERDHNGNIYAGSDENVYQFQADSQSWLPLGEGIEGAARLVVDNNNVLYSADIKGVYFFDSTTKRWISTHLNNDLPLDTLPLGFLVAPDPDNTLYVALQNGKFYSYDGSKWSTMPSLPLQTRSKLYDLVLDSKTGVFYAAVRAGDPSNTDGGVWKFSENAWHKMPATPNAFPLNLYSFFVAIGPDNTLYTGGYDEVYQYNTSNNLWESMKLADSNDSSQALWVMKFSNDNLFVGGTEIFEYTDSHNWQDQKLPLASNLALGADVNNTLFLGTSGSGMYEYTGSTWDKANKGIMCGAEDEHAAVYNLLAANDSLYATTNCSKVYRYNTISQTWNDMSNGLQTTAPYTGYSIVNDSNDNLYLGTRSGVYQYVNNKWTITGAITIPTGMAIISLVADKEYVYAGMGAYPSSSVSHAGEIYRLANGTNTWNKLNFPTLSSGVSSMVYDNVNSRIYVGTANDGLYYCTACATHTPTWTKVPEADEQIKSVIAAASGDIYFSTKTKGVFKLTSAGSLLTNIGLSDYGSIGPLFLDSDNVLYAAMSVGPVAKATHH
jgi:ligand-binding sensor domain-containing protein